MARLSWPADVHAEGYDLYRKRPEEPSWFKLGSLPANAVSYADTNITAGFGYEYMIVKVSSGGQESWRYKGYGYLYAGAELPLKESRGKVILLIERSLSQPLEAELLRLEFDLIADGWAVVREEASRTEPVTAVKSRIQNIFYSDPHNTRALILFGNIPVPYSGRIAPDDHGNHLGAWPADVYYADMDGLWTDETVHVEQAERPENHNIPGDGKFDQSSPPSLLELQVGRIDLSNLTCFANKSPSLKEVDLARRYLEKNHAFRSGLQQASAKAVILDRNENTDPEPFGANLWRQATPFVGMNVIAPGDLQLFDLLRNDSFLWWKTASWGSYTRGGSVGTSDAFALNTINAVFTTFVGSYFGDWNNESNFLRAALGAEGMTLTTCYSGKPPWFFHHMALGETIGYSTQVTQQNGPGGAYLPSIEGAGQVHISLLGDPTLRAHPLPPVNSLSGVRSGTGSLTLTLAWEAPERGSVQGYHIYRASNPKGPYERVNETLVSGKSYAVQNAGFGEHFMVKAISLTETPAGTYFNSSHGSFFPDPLLPPAAAPLVAFDQTASGPEDQPLAVRLVGAGPSGTLNFAVIGFPSKGSLSGTAPDVVYTPGPNFSGSDVFTFLVSDGFGQSSPGVVTVQIAALNDPPYSVASVVSAGAGQPILIPLQGGDVDGDPVTYRIAAQPAHGQLSGSGASLTYTSDSAFAGTDTISFVVSDGQLESSPATVTIHVSPGNRPPIAYSSEIRIPEDQGTSLSLQANDPDFDQVTFEVLTRPAHGHLSGVPPSLIYVPEPNFNGRDSFSFVARDAVSQSAPAIFGIVVTPQNDVPTAASFGASGRAGELVEIVLQAEDIDGDALDFRIVSEPAHGQLSGTGAVLAYVSNAEFLGMDSFAYVADDGTTESAPATVTIDIAAGNGAPVAHDAELRLREGQSTAMVLTATDPEEDALTFQIVLGPANGTLSGTPPNLIFVPHESFSGLDRFMFAASDGQATSAVATVTLRIDAVNDAPVFSPVADITFGKNAGFEFRFVVIDPDSEAVSVTAVSDAPTLLGPESLTIGGSMLRIAPIRGAAGTAIITLRADDAENQVETSFRLTVTNAPPMAVDDEIVAHGQTLSISAAALLSNDHDPDGDLLEIAAVQGTSEAGAAVSLSDGLVHYSGLAPIPAPDSFTYDIRDVSGALARAKVRVKAGLPPRIESLARHSSGSFVMRASGAAAQRYRVELSEDSKAWKTIVEGTADSSGAVQLDLPHQSEGVMRLFRIALP